MHSEKEVGEERERERDQISFQERLCKRALLGEEGQY